MYTECLLNVLLYTECLLNVLLYTECKVYCSIPVKAK